MSGHSKWSTIKRQKQATDKKRGQLFTKITRAITLAVGEGGGITDSASNFRLRLAIEKAKEINMPKDNIERAVERGIGKGEGSNQIESVVYEGYGPGGVAFVIECATDNKQRTGAQVKHILDRVGGSLAGTGSVNYLFDQQGMIVVKKGGADEDVMLEKAIEAGALDMQPESDDYVLYTAREDLHKVKEALTKAGFTPIESELVYRPKSTIPIGDSTIARSIVQCIDNLEELDDVQRVFTNEDIDDSLIQQLS